MGQAREPTVTIVHLPSGIVAGCRGKRSPRENRNEAMRMLRSQLWLQNRAEALRRSGSAPIAIITARSP